MHRGSTHQALDQTVLKWFLNIRSQNVPLSSAIVQVTTSRSYVKKLNRKFQILG